MRVLLQDGRIGVIEVAPWLFKDVKAIAESGKMTAKFLVRLNFLQVKLVDVVALEEAD